MKNFGEAVREKRKSEGLKVFELANKVGVNAVYITQIEKHNKLPSDTVATNICTALDDKSLLKYWAEDKLKEGQRKAKEVQRKAQESVVKTTSTLNIDLKTNIKVPKKKKGK